MKASCLVLAAASLATASAQAQLVAPADAPQLQRQPLPQGQAFANSFQPLPRPYITNENADPGAWLFPDYRTDPKLVLGFDLNPNFAIETGYQNLVSRGFHYPWPGDAADLAGAQGVRGSASYLAAKLTVPVDARFSVDGKLGVAYTSRNLHDSTLTTLREGDVGPYASIGARYKLGENASLSAQYEKFGDSEKKFGNDANATGLKAKLNIGFGAAAEVARMLSR